MLETRLLRRVIHYIWECYRDERTERFSLTNYKGSELRVEERASDLTVTVRYFIKQPSGELLKALDVTCFILRSGEWIPLTLLVGDSSVIVGTADPQTSQVTVIDQDGQMIAAGLCDTWALWLLEEGFLAAAALYRPFGGPPPHASWPQPTVPLPGLEQLEDWRWEDGGCESTDGCWVAYNGICPHGHPLCAPRSVPMQSSKEEPKNGVS
jgi:hypothetical protein